MHEIELGGKKYPIAFPVGALKRFAQRVGASDPLGGLSALNEEGKQMDMFLALTYAGLEAGARQTGQSLAIAPDEIEDFFTLRDIEAVTGILPHYLPAVTPGEAIAATAGELTGTK